MHVSFLYNISSILILPKSRNSSTKIKLHFPVQGDTRKWFIVLSESTCSSARRRSVQAKILNLSCQTFVPYSAVTPFSSRYFTSVILREKKTVLQRGVFYIMHILWWFVKKNLSLMRAMFTFSSYKQKLRAITRIFLSYLIKYRGFLFNFGRLSFEEHCNLWFQKIMDY